MREIMRFRQCRVSYHTDREVCVLWCMHHVLLPHTSLAIPISIAATGRMQTWKC